MVSTLKIKPQNPRDSCRLEKPYFYRVGRSNRNYGSFQLERTASSHTAYHRITPYT